MKGEVKKEERPGAEVSKDEAATPAGDFVAQVAAAVAVIFTFLTFYTDTAAGGKAVKGYETPYGIIILIVGALCFIFASAVLWSKFLDRDFWLVRSPGWAYSATAAVVVVVSVLAMVFAKENYDVNWGAPLVELITGVIIGIGGMLKF
jgi:uncharacterized membrane protein YidH (DUF202 family)